MEIIEQNTARPWQGTVLGILNIIGLAFSSILILVLIIAMAFGAAFIEPFISNIQLPITLGLTAILIILLAILLPFSILYIFITVGIFNGAKWAIVIHLVFTALGVVGNLISFNIFGLAYQGFMLYCCVACMKEPFYNQNSIRA